MKTILKGMVALSLVSSVAFAIENEENNFKKKLANYAKEYKVSKEFYEKFKTEKKPLIEYFSADLKNSISKYDLEEYQNYKGHFETSEIDEKFKEFSKKVCKDKISFENGIIKNCNITQADMSMPDTEYKYLIFSCEKNKCEIVDIGTKLCAYILGDCDGAEVSFSWLK